MFPRQIKRLIGYFPVGQLFDQVIAITFIMEKNVPLEINSI